jgi:hypothetical protein
MDQFCEGCGEKVGCGCTTCQEFYRSRRGLCAMCWEIWLAARGSKVWWPYVV